MKINFNCLFAVYLLLFELAELLEVNTIVLVIILIINVLVLLTDRKQITFILLLSLVMGNELISIISVLACLFVGRKKLPIKRLGYKCWLFIFAIITTSFFNAVVYGTYWNLVFELVYLSIIFLVATYTEGVINPESTLISIKKLLFIETIVMTTQIIKYKSLIPGDLYCGTFNSAHWFGNWLVCALVIPFALSPWKQEMPWWKNIKLNITYCVLALYCLYFSDAKHVILSFVVGSFFFLLYNKAFKKNGFFVFVISSYLFMFFFSFVYTSPFIVDSLSSVSTEIETYLYSASLSGKFNYVFGVLNSDLIGPHFLFGYGLGQFGSRVSNLFAYSVMYRSDNAVNNLIASTFSPHYIKAFGDYISFYSPEFVENIKNISAVLSYPFNDFIAFIAETGFIGIIGFSLIANNYIQNSRTKLLAYYFFIVCFFDIYFGDFSCIAMVIIIIKLTKIDKEKILRKGELCKSL